MREQLWHIKNSLVALPKRLLLTLTQPIRDHALRKLIEGKRVLIVGSGPSAENLPTIPSDMLVFACNLSPAFLPTDGNGRRHADLYLLSKNAYLDYRGKIEALLKTLEVNTLATRDRSFVSSLPFASCKRSVYERFVGSQENYGFRRLVGESMSNELRSAASRKTPSSGVGLLIYAIIYGATEIFVAGMDLGEHGTEFSNWQQSTGERHPHLSIDEAVLRHIAEHHRNVFSAIRESPLTNIFPHKKLV